MIEFKSETGKFYTEGYLEVAGDVDISGDVCTEHCIESIVSQCLGTEMKAVTSTTATKRALKMSADHAHFIGGDRREMPVGKIVDAKKVVHEGKAKAWIKTEVNMNHPEYKSIKGCIEDGYFDAYSIEYIPTDTGKTIDGKRILNDIKVTGAAYTGRPVLHSATMTEHYAKSMTFEQFKSEMDKEKECEYDEDDIKEGLAVEQEHKDTVHGDQEIMRKIAIDHLEEDPEYYKKLKKMEQGKSSDIMETKTEAKTDAPVAEQVKSDVPAPIQAVTPPVEQAKSEVKEEAKSKDLLTLEQVKSMIAEEIKKNAEEMKSKVLTTSKSTETAKEEAKSQRVVDYIIENSRR